MGIDIKFTIQDSAAMKIFCLFLFLSLASPLAIAETNPALPVLSGEQGEPLRVTWQDGREATAMSAIIEPLTLEAPMTVYENSCNEILTNKCKFIAGLHAYRIYLKWTKHPDAKKIGQSLRFRIKSSSSEQFMDFMPVLKILVPLHRSVTPVAARNVADDEIFCEDYSFLPRDPFQSPNLHILRWEMESMRQNPETGAMQNRSMGGALDIELVPQPDRHLKLKVHGGYTTTDVIAGGDVLSLTLKNKNNQLCQIGIKPDFTSVTARFISYFNPSTSEKLQPYLLGTDEFFPTLLKQVKLVTQLPETFEVEP